MRRENESLKATLREFQDGDKSRTQMALELTALREELARVRDEDVQELTDVRKAIKDFTLTTQMELETEVARLETRCTVAEEQLKASNEYLSEATVKYQVETIIRKGKVERPAIGATPRCPGPRALPRGTASSGRPRPRSAAAARSAA